MPYHVVIQMPVEIYDGTTWMFQRKNVRMLTEPAPGKLLVGGGIPHSLGEKTNWATIIHTVGEDLDQRAIFCRVHGFRDTTHDQLEILAMLNEDDPEPRWTVSPEPFIVPQTGKEGAANGGVDDDKYDDGYPPPDWS